MVTSTADVPAAARAHGERSPGWRATRLQLGPRGLRSWFAGSPIRPMQLSRAGLSARVALVPQAALLLAGDSVSVEVEVLAGCRLEIVEPAGTVAYDMRGGEASMTVRVRVDAGGCLLWRGQPFVVASGARVRRRTEVRLGPSAALLLQDTLVLGRSFEAPGSLHVRTEVTRSTAPLLVEEIELSPATQVPGILGAHRVLDSVLAVGLDVTAPVEAARYDLEGGAVLWRALCTDLHLSPLCAGVRIG